MTTTRRSRVVRPRDGQARARGGWAQKYSSVRCHHAGLARTLWHARSSCRGTAAGLCQRSAGGRTACAWSACACACVNALWAHTSQSRNNAYQCTRRFSYRDHTMVPTCILHSLHCTSESQSPVHDPCIPVHSQVQRCCARGAIAAPQASPLPRRTALLGGPRVTVAAPSGCHERLTCPLSRRPTTMAHAAARLASLPVPPATAA